MLAQQQLQQKETKNQTRKTVPFTATAQPATLPQIEALKIFEQTKAEIKTMIKVETPIEQTYEEHDDNSDLINEMLQNRKITQNTSARIMSHCNTIKDKTFAEDESATFSKTIQSKWSTYKNNDFENASLYIQTIDSKIEKYYKQIEAETEKLLNLQKKAVESKLAEIEAEKQKRIIEEQKREMERIQQLKRIEEENRKKAFAGTYTNMHDCPCLGKFHEHRIINIQYSNGRYDATETYEWDANCGYLNGKYAGTVYTAQLKVDITGNQIYLTETSFGFLSGKNPNNLSPSDFKHFFEGIINSDGSITGHWFDTNVTENSYVYKKIN